MKIFLFILLATVLEAIGDAVLRMALHTGTTPARVGLFAVGALLLTGYGTSLNLAPEDFGTVTGLYVAMVFLCFQVTNYLFFRALPTSGTLAGGALIVGGGAIVYWWR